MTRWWIFNAVGAMGLAVQLGVLHVSTAVFGVPYLLATLLAVESAVLHNFAWHERWTWSDRASTASRWKRLGEFHAANGLVSIAGNLALMRLFVGSLRLPLLAANLAAIAICALLNFVLSDTIVYRRAAR